MSYSWRVFIYLIICLFVVFVYLSRVYASVVLNEIAIQPNQVVELYNTASESADISSWYIDDAGGSYFTIPPRTILAPKSCLLFSSNFYFNVSTADVVRLFDNTNPPTSSAKLIEQYFYVKAPDANYSFSKKTDGGGEWQTVSSSLGLSNESLLSCVPTPTSIPSPSEIPSPFPTTFSSPTTEPIQTPSPTPQSDYQDILISEVYPYPYSGEQEWVEFYNENNTQVNLDHWYIDDIENGGSAPKSFSLVIDPYSYAVVTLTSSMFNNDGDAVRLLDSNKAEKDSMEYGKITQGKSIGRISFSEDSYCEQEPSKNTANSSCFSTSTESPVSIQSTHNAVGLTQKITSPTKKPINLSSQQISTRTNSISTTASQSQGEVLGIQEKETPHTSPTPYLSFVSGSYSLLTIVSLFIKMKNA